MDTEKLGTPLGKADIKQTRHKLLLWCPTSI